MTYHRLTQSAAASDATRDNRIADLVNDLATGLETVEAAGVPVNVATATLTSGAVTVSDTAITANSVIRLSSMTAAGTPGAVYVSARVASTSFTLTSTSNTDASVYRYEVLAY